MKNVESRILKLIVIIVLFQPLMSSGSKSHEHSEYENSSLKYKHYKEAVREHDKAIQIDPKNPIPHYAKGNLLTKMREFLKANDEYDKGIALDKKDKFLADIYSLKALNLTSLNHYEEAIIEYDKAIRLDGSHFRSLSGKGRALSMLHKYDEAIAIYNKALTLNHPESEIVYVARAQVFSNIAEYDKALADCDTAIKLNDKFSIAYLGKGFVLKILEKNQEALINFEKAIELDPNLGPIEKYINNDEE